jgi:hypothetical protein
LPAALDGVPFAEIRLDRMTVDENGVRRIFSGRRSHRGLPAWRHAGGDAEGPAPGRHAAGASSCGYRGRSVEATRRPVVEAAKWAGCGSSSLITISADRRRGASFEAVVERCFALGADIAKIACRVESGSDNARPSGLDDARPWRSWPGRKGRRQGDGLLLEPPFVYALREDGRETAEGQIAHVRLCLHDPDDGGGLN